MSHMLFENIFSLYLFLVVKLPMDVKSCYPLLSTETRKWVPMSWKSFTLPKVSFFAWEAWHGKILTTENLEKKGIPLASRCYLCWEKEEAIGHLLIHCSRSQILWNLIFSLFRTSWVMEGSLRGLAELWELMVRGKPRKKAWKVGCFCSCWLIWKVKKWDCFWWWGIKWSEMENVPHNNSVVLDKESTTKPFGIHGLALSIGKG